MVVNRTQNSESKITTVYIRDFNGQLLCKREVIFEGMKEGTQYGKALDINEECKVLWYAEWDKSMVG